MPASKSRMKITRVEPIGLFVPLDEPIEAPISLSHADELTKVVFPGYRSTLVRIHTDAGITGIGECLVRLAPNSRGPRSRGAGHRLVRGAAEPGQHQGDGGDGESARHPDCRGGSRVLDLRLPRSVHESCDRRRSAQHLAGRRDHGRTAHRSDEPRLPHPLRATHRQLLGRSSGRDASVCSGIAEFPHLQSTCRATGRRTSPIRCATTCSGRRPSSSRTDTWSCPTRPASVPTSTKTFSTTTAWHESGWKGCIVGRLDARHRL